MNLSERGRRGGLTSHALNDPRERMANARAAFLASFATPEARSRYFAEMARRRWAGQQVLHEAALHGEECDHIVLCFDADGAATLYPETTDPERLSERFRALILALAAVLDDSDLILLAGAGGKP